jgi:hypothetical protein
VWSVGVESGKVRLLTGRGWLARSLARCGHAVPG